MALLQWRCAQLLTQMRKGEGKPWNEATIILPVTDTTKNNTGQAAITDYLNMDNYSLPPVFVSKDACILKPGLMH